MAEDQSRAYLDRLKVNVDDPHEVRFWMRQLSCTEAELRDCVKRVGSKAADVRKCLGRP